MPAPFSPAATQEPSFRGRARYSNPNLRVSDAERAEVADRLSQHYSDGRLDQEEFSKRLDQAMGAVTQSDLAGLFDDLPDTEPAGPGGPGRGLLGAMGTEPPRGEPTADPRPRRRRRSCQRVLELGLIIVIAIAVGRLLAQIFVPWFLIALLAVAWLRYGPTHRRRY
ncbi:MAG TPA: DUF1707 domain-containing protein [Streptosporangiaceae bacterium]|nr:DUF1707 domain-containing protein [Streptosporangiaceae bacterium]